MYSFRKLIYLPFYFLNINFSFCLNIYKEELQKIEKEFIIDNINSNIKNLTNERDQLLRTVKKADNEVKLMRVSTAIIDIYNNVTKNKKDADFKYIYDLLTKVIEFDFSRDDTEYGCSNQFLILRSLLFNALKKEKVDDKNFDNYINCFKDLNKKKIIGYYTYKNAEKYIFKSIFNQVTYGDINTPKVLTNYNSKFAHLSSPEGSHYFKQFLEDLFAYIVDKETKSCNEINKGNKDKILTILNNFPTIEEKKYKKYVEFLFYLLSKDFDVVYNQNKNSFLLNSTYASDEIYNREIKNKEDLEKYKKEIGFLHIKNIENISPKVEVLKDLENFFYYNATVQPLKVYYEYQKEMDKEFKEIATGNFNISFKFKNDIKVLEGHFIAAHKHCKNYFSKNRKNIYDDLLEIYNSLKDKKIKKNESNGISVYSEYSRIIYNIGNKEKINTTNDAKTSFKLVNDYKISEGHKQTIESFKKNITDTKKEIEELKKNYNFLNVEVDLSRYTEDFFNNLLQKDFEKTKKEIENLKTKIKSIFEQLKNDLISKIKKINEIIANNKEIKEKLNIDTSKYSDEFISGLNFDNIKNKEKEIVALYDIVNIEFKYDSVTKKLKKEVPKKEEKKEELNKPKIENKEENKEIKKEEKKEIKKEEKKEEPKIEEKVKNKEKIKIEKKEVPKKENVDKEKKGDNKEVKEDNISKNVKKENVDKEKKEEKEEEPKIEPKEEGNKEVPKNGKGPKKEEKIEKKKEENDEEKEKPKKVENNKEVKKEIKKEEIKEEKKEEKIEEKEEGNNEEYEENNEGEEGDNEEGPKKEEKIEKKDEEEDEEEEEDDDDDEKKDEKEKWEKKEELKKEGPKIEKNNKNESIKNPSKNKDEIKNDKIKNKKKAEIITEKGKNNDNSTTTRSCCCKKCNCKRR